MMQLQSVPTTYVTGIKETYFEIYTKQVSCQLALPLLNISNCQSVFITNSLYLHDSYITKFDFMNFDFSGSCMVVSIQYNYIKYMLINTN